MSRVLTNEQNYYDIADTIRQMKDVSTTYKPREMASALKDIYSNEVEGTLPLSFEANGNNLLDYRIDGASGGVGDRTKNLLNNILNTQIKNGVTFTVNEDKSVTCNGKNQNEDQGLFITIGDYSATNNVILSGGVSGGNLSSYILRAYTLTDNPVVYYDDGNGVTLLAGKDYRIQIRIAGDYTCNNLTFYPMIRLASIQDDTYEPYGYKAPVIISGKNLLPTPEVKSQTVNGVTISRFVNGIITIKGTPTAQMDVKFNFEESTFSAGSYIHLRNNFSTYNFAVSFRKDGVNKIAPGLGTLNSIKQITEDITVNQMVVLCNNNAIGTNYDITIQPSIELTNEETSYEPYHEPTTTNIYLDEPIEENESISLSDTEVDIPTIEGTNTLTIDTTVQPSNVYVQARKDSDDVVFLTQILEEGI
jgi:hypothetical protein